MATPDSSQAPDLSAVYDALRKADAAGDVEGAKQLASYIQGISAAPKQTDYLEQAGQKYVPQSTLGRFGAGVEKGMVDMGLGIGHRLGLYSTEDVENVRRLNAPLMRTTPAKWGSPVGTAITAAPTMFIPGANTVGGAALIGGGVGLMQPSTSLGETATNTGLGAAGGPIGLGIGRGLGALGSGLMAAIRPLLPGGSQRIAANTLQSFAGGSQPAQAAAQQLQNLPAMLPGAQPTMGELTQNAGLAQLERTLRNNPELANAFGVRDQTNTAAATQALRGIAGNDAAMEAARQARTAAAEPLYRSASNDVVARDDVLDKLLARPSLKKAWDRAETLAAERGESLAGQRPAPIPAPSPTPAPVPTAQAATPSSQAAKSSDPLAWVDKVREQEARAVAAGNIRGQQFQADVRKALQQRGIEPDEDLLWDINTFANRSGEDAVAHVLRQRELNGESIPFSRLGAPPSAAAPPGAAPPTGAAASAAAGDIPARTLQYLKMALQDTVNTGPQQGIGAHELGATRNTLSALQDWITKNAPGLRQADQAYAAASVPINRMAVGQELADRLTPALSDFAAAPNRLNAASFARGVRNGDQVAARATGNARATLEGTLAPDQMQTLRQIGEQLARRANAQDLGRAIGSNTGQNLAGQNVLRSILGPLGLPDSAIGRAAESFLGQSLARPYGWLSSAAQPAVLRELGEASLNPQQAARLLSMRPTGRVAQELWRRHGLLAAPGAAAATSINAPQQ